MTARMLTLVSPAGEYVGLVPAVAVAPGLLLTRGDRYCECDSCEEANTPPAWCPRGSWSWRLVAESGILVTSAGRSFGEFRAAAAELAGLPVPWGTPDVAALTAAVTDPDVRALALGVLSRLLRGEFGSDPTGYDPTDITPPELQPAGIAASVREGWVSDQATDPTQITNWRDRQAAALIPFEVVAGLPRNPNGRTGRCGRNLGRWGENQAADPVVVTGTVPGRRVLLIRRDDCGHWAIPGGMVDPGETAPAALVRELREETGVDLAGVEPVVLARTYVDDPRNSDHAWICSTVALFRVAEPVGATAGSDATDARWFPFDDLDQLRAAIRATGGQLYAAHGPLLGQVPAT